MVLINILVLQLVRINVSMEFIRSATRIVQKREPLVDFLYNNKIFK